MGFCMNDEIKFTISQYEELILENAARMQSNDVIVNDGFKAGRAKDYASLFLNGSDIKKLAEQAADDFHSETKM